ncbi:MAG TPA: helix-turn-helix transcriptional regulator [Longimicrobium sp.]|nr:helix-turn-helix transcriptional regulator [Longimicrobium sp.]
MGETTLEGPRLGSSSAGDGVEEWVWEQIRRVAHRLYREAPAAADDAVEAAFAPEGGPAGYRLLVRRLTCGENEATVLACVLQHVEPPLPREERLRELFRLTPRESRVAVLLARRHSTGEICTELGISTHTARRHVEKVLLKLGVHRRPDVRRALLSCARG